MSKVKERLIEYIKTIGKNISEFEREIGVSSGYISNISKSIQPDKLEIISEKHPSLNIEWLLVGIGSMFKEDTVNDNSQIIDTAIWSRFEEFATKHYPNYIKDLKRMSVELNMNSSRLKDLLIDGAFLKYSEILTLSYAGVNIDWLLTGNGSMLKSEQPVIQPVSTPQEEGTPLLPVEAWGGSLSGSSIAVLAEQCKKYNVPISNIDYLIPIAGDSMMPDYCPGDVVAIKKVNEKAFIEWGKAYVLDTCNGVIIKEVQPSENDGCITCISRNTPTKYKPFEINLCPEDFFGMYAVKGTVRIS